MLLVGVIWVMRHIEHLLKVLLDFSVPLFIGHRELFAYRYNRNVCDLKVLDDKIEPVTNISSVPKLSELPSCLQRQHPMI